MKEIQYKFQQFQADACNAICDVFDGQPRLDSATYIIDPGVVEKKDLLSEAVQDAYANQNILLPENILLQNIRATQSKFDIEPVDEIVDYKSDGLNLSVEMETGTGKTFVYIKTIHELHKRYGWTKFIIVVPSIAIREGTYSSFQDTAKYFKMEYGQTIDVFIYNSANLDAVENFATSPHIEVMIINSQAFASRADDRIFTTVQPEKFKGRKPIDVVAATHPIIILDEPQSINGDVTVQKLRDFKPLFTLRYSATHRRVFNLMYRLDSIDAYNKNLVKKIAVKGVTVLGNNATNSYVFFSKLDKNKNQDPYVWLEIDYKTKEKVIRKHLRLTEGDNLYDKSGQLREYEDGWVIGHIDGEQALVPFENGVVLAEGDSVGQLDENQVRRVQIRETIRSHLEKEESLYDKKIKVLSLFFIDEVAKYRTDDGEPGEYAKMFEEEYQFAVERRLEELDLNQEYKKFLQKTVAATSHNGYFSKDKKGKLINTNGQSLADMTTYDLIMKNKKRLLSFDEPTRFIFSHSALKEGWDNQNVFQICVLKNTDNNTRRRQELGRGMRLCVNDNGTRMDEAEVGDKVHEINVLTVVAPESYSEYAKGLQSEYAETVQYRPKKVDVNLFLNKQVMKDGELHTITEKDAQEIVWHMIVQQYVDPAGKLTQKYHDDIEAGTFKAPEGYATDQIVDVIKNIYRPIEILNAGKRKVHKIRNEDNFNKQEFKELWSRINKKSFYTVDFKTDDLVKKAINALDQHLHVTPLVVAVSQAKIKKISDNAEFDTFPEEVNREDLSVIETNLNFDLIGEIAKGTSLTRSAVADILTGIEPNTFAKFKAKPQEFIDNAIEIINTCKATTVIEGIEYKATNDEFSTDIFTKNDLVLADKAFETPKHNIYNYVVTDSNVERKIAKELEAENDVCVYAKLPSDFYIFTPMGKYNPDWAIACKQGDVKRVYFVAETKGVHSELDVNLAEMAKAKASCAKKHFATICGDNNIKYGIIENYEDLTKLLKE